MLTIEVLKTFGADTSDGLKRCLDNEAFYLKLVSKALEDKNFDMLEEAVAAGDLDNAFEAAHSLKGVLGNLALTPIYKPVYDITELLRARTDTDYTSLIREISDKREQLVRLM